MTAGPQIVIRRAEDRDLPALGRLGAHLLRTHHELDGARFMAPGEDPEGGYAWFLGTQLRDRDAVVLVAAHEPNVVVGYAYAGLEPQSWKELREPAGFIHDLVVDEASRGQGIASALVSAAMDWLRERGAPRVLLWTAQHNVRAQHLFARLGFRRTMIEMTLEL